MALKLCPAAALPAGISISHHLQQQLSIIILLVHCLALPEPFWGHKFPWQGPLGPNWACGGRGVSGGAVTARGQHRPWEGIGPGLFSAPLEMPGCRMRDAADLSLCMMGKSQLRAAPLRPHRHSDAHRPLLLLARAACSPAWQLGLWGPPALPGCWGAGSIPWGLEGWEESWCLGEVAMGRGWPVLHRGGGAWG